MINSQADGSKYHSKPSFNVHSIWRSTTSSRVLQVYVLFHLAFSFCFIYLFSRYIRVSRWLVVFHMSIAAGLLAGLIITTGLLLLSRHLRAWRSTRYGIACIYATWTAVITFLYLMDFISYKLWGADINYLLVSQYVFRHNVLGNNALSLSYQIYLALALGLTLIFIVHLGLGKKIQTGLEQFFLPGNSLSLFRDRRRALKSCAGLGVMLVVYGVYVHTTLKGVGTYDFLTYEPITAFFNTTLLDTHHDALTARLRVEEPQIRAGYPHGQSFEKKNVIIIIVDALRADHTQVYGYKRPTTPFLNRLLETGKLRKVEFATSTCSESNCGILSTLSSKTSRALIPEDFKLHDLLHDQGYKTYFILSGTHDWYGLKQAYGNDLTLYFDGTSSKKYTAMTDDRLVFEASEKVPQFDGTPAFFYFHLMSAHQAGIRQEQYRIYQPDMIEHDWEMLVRGKYNAAAAINNYDNGVVQADAMIQQLFADLQRKGYLDNSLVVILADHGEGLGERSGSTGFGHAHLLYQEFIRIPLLIYDDSKTEYANLKFATQIDVAPTILARLGLSIPASWQGQSLLDPDSKQYEFHQTQGRVPSYAILFRTQGAMYKYFYRTWDGVGVEELYELNSDPGETHNLFPNADPSLIKQLRAKLEEYLAQS